MKRNDGERDNLFDNIYLSLRQDILWLRLKPGRFSPRLNLADKFQSSKTPVREALMRLSFDGLVNVFPAARLLRQRDFVRGHKGHARVPLGAREHVSREGDGRCATEEQIEKLDSLSYTDRLFYRDEEPRFSRTPQEEPRDSEFHIYLAEIAGNKIIHAQLIDVLEKLQRPMLCVAEENYMSRGVEEHHILACMIRDKKADEARELLRGHINEVYEHCLRISTIAKLF